MILKHSYLSSRTKMKAGFGPRKARKFALTTILAHVKYLAHRPGPDREQDGRKFFSTSLESANSLEVRKWLRQDLAKGDLVFHKLLLAPEVNPDNIQAYATAIMKELSNEKGLNLDWRAVVHENTDNHHVHVVVKGRDLGGRQVRFDRRDHALIKDIGDKWLHQHEYEKLRDRADRVDERHNLLATRDRLLAKERRNMYRHPGYLSKAARDARNRRHALAPSKGLALYLAYLNPERDLPSSKAKERRERVGGKIYQPMHFTTRQAKDLKSDAPRLRTQEGHDRYGGRWYAPGQMQITQSIGFSIFYSAAQLARSLAARYVPTARDALSPNFRKPGELKARRNLNQIDGSLTRPSGGISRAALSALDTHMADLDRHLKDPDRIQDPDQVRTQEKIQIKKQKQDKRDSDQLGRLRIDEQRSDEKG